MYIEMIGKYRTERICDIGGWDEERDDTNAHERTASNWHAHPSQELRHHADILRGVPLTSLFAGSDGPDLVAASLCEPEVAIRACRNPIRLACRCWDYKFGNCATGADTPYFAVAKLGEPEVAIRSRCNAGWPALRCWDWKLGN